MTKLTDLELHGEKITDKGLANLAGLTQLKRLNLANTDITDAGLKHLENLGSLRDLSLAGTRVDGSGLAAISTLDLVTLDLDNTHATDACLTHIGRFPHLLMLGYRGPKSMVPACSISPRCRASISRPERHEDRRCLRWSIFEP